MPNPNVELNIQDPGLGIVPASAGRTQVKIGVANKPTPNVVLSAGSKGTLRSLLGSGPLLEAAAQVLNRAGGQVILVPLEPATYGTVTGGFTLTGSGTGTVTGSRGPEQIVRVKIVLGGALATMTFQVAIGPGSGGYGPVITSGADPYTYIVPGQRFTKLAFATGTYVANDVYTLNLDGTVTRVGSGTATLLDGSTNSPVDAYALAVRIVSGGALGTATFQYSLDSFDPLDAEQAKAKTWSGEFIIPAGGKYVLPGTGIVLTFAGTFTTGDIYKGSSTAPTVTASEINAGFDALLSNASEWGFAHVVGKASNAAAAAVIAAAVGAKMDEAKAAYRFVRAIVECPQDSDNDIKSAFASFVHERVGVVAGDVDLVSAVSLRTERRNLANAYTAGLSATKLAIHPGETTIKNGAGALRGVTKLYRDEEDTPGLDPARFVTARTIVGKPGFYITRGRMMAAPGSDFGQIMHCRVMDRICTVTRSMLVDFLNTSPRIDKVTGFILEIDAQEIEAICNGKLKAAVEDEGEVSSIDFVAARNDNLLTTSLFNVEISAVPLGYLETIRASLGFVNPALAAAA